MLCGDERQQGTIVPGVVVCIYVLSCRLSFQFGECVCLCLDDLIHNCINGSVFHCLCVCVRIIREEEK